MKKYSLSFLISSVGIITSLGATSSSSYNLMDMTMEEIRQVDYYTLLGIPENASNKQIEEAIDLKMKECTPRNQDEKKTATTRKMVLDEIKTVLTNPAPRAAYDRSLFGVDHEWEVIKHEPNEEWEIL